MTIYDELMNIIDEELEKSANITTLLQIGASALVENIKKKKHLFENFKKIKRYSIDHLDELVKKATESLKAVNCNVFYAKTADDALSYISREVEGEKATLWRKTGSGRWT